MPCNTDPHRSRAVAERASTCLLLVLVPLALIAAARHAIPQEVPPVQMLVPGFVVRQIPFDHQNVNAVAYGPDGRLFALGYNGTVHVLSDTDGDGLEDRSETWWKLQGDGSTRGPSGRTPVSMVASPEGVYVTTTGSVLLLTDTDGDGRADAERVVATDWEPPNVFTGGSTDALGIARDEAGSIYFALGAADYTEAYMVDTAGRSGYRLTSERGTVLRVPADGGPREIFATGTRFPTTLAFNHRGHLFAVDQEGATWLLNGNPFDELLHIERGRHYGFPPRHPQHLPAVIDEPSVYDFRPQHQSVTGLAFNGPADGGPRVGPSWWAHDAFTTGYSRGKLYRTRLVETPHGYIAQTAQIGSLPRLAVSVAVSPGGALVVATHSGQPDWGRGPSGDGALYKIFYADEAAPQPVLAWATQPREVHVAFDRPLAPEHLRRAQEGVRIEYGPHVGAGDRFERLQPGYATVLMQRRASPSPLAVEGVTLSDDRRTLVVRTAAHPQSSELRYAITIPSTAVVQEQDPSALAQEAALDLLYTPAGVEAVWQSRSGGERQAWLPHLDLDASRGLTAASAPHDELWAELNAGGRLTLRTQLDVSNMLRPVVQAGSRLDYSLPPENVKLLLSSTQPLQVETSQQVRQTHSREGERHQVLLEIDSVQPSAGLIPLVLELSGDATAPVLDVSWHTADDPRPRALQTHRMLLPWTDKPAVAAGVVAQTDRNAPELAGGSWSEGRRVFQTHCSSCHVNRAVGGTVGPDLSNLMHRDPGSVLRDIESPSAVINPDYVLYRVRFRDGQETHSLLAPPRPEYGMSTVLRDLAGNEQRYGTNRIESIEPLPVSAMPEGLDDAIGEDGMRDVLTYLLTEPLEPAEQQADGAPPYRSHDDVRRLLSASGDAAPAAAVAPLNVLLVAGPKTHGRSEHDYALWRDRWSTLLGLAEGVQVDTAWIWPDAAQLSRADVMVVYSANDGWNTERARELDAFLNRGGGAVFIHYGIHGRDAVAEMSELAGLAWRAQASSYRHGPLDLNVTDTSHPITAGFGDLSFYDESYWNLEGDTARVRVLATAVEDGQARPQVWTLEHGRGRVLVSLPGHYTWTFDDPLYRVMLLRGIAWAGHQHVGRLTDLATVGARVR